MKQLAILILLAQATPAAWAVEEHEQPLKVVTQENTAGTEAFTKAFKELYDYQTWLGTSLGLYTFDYKQDDVQYDNNTVLQAITTYTSIYQNLAGNTETTLLEGAEYINGLLDCIKATDSEGNRLYMHLNMPETGSLMRLLNTTGDQYYTAGETDVETAIVTSAANIFYYYKNTSTTETSQDVLLSYTKGTFLQLDGDSRTLSETPQAISITQADAKELDGLYLINNQEYRLEEVTSLPVTIGETGWATFFTPTPVAIPYNVKTYLETGNVTNGELPITQITGSVPAETALILNAPKGTYTFSIIPSTSGDKSPNTVLKGTYPATTATTDVLTLQAKDNSVGFYKWEAGKDITAFKVYMNIPTESSDTKGYVLTLDGESGIEGISNKKDASQARVYTLQGIPVGTDPQRLSHGIYIVGNRKVVK